MNFDDHTCQKNFRTVFYPDSETLESLLVTDFGYLEELDRDMQPLAGDYQLSFEVKYEPISMEAEVEVDGEMTDMWSVCAEHLSGGGHKIGGYPFFTQQDPRNEEGGFNILLLQIDTDDENNIMWAVTNLFIREEDLRNLNFSNVFYNWDCY